MINENIILEYLKSNLKESRFIHSRGVMQTAVLLAQRYGEDTEKARIAGLVHDCAKSMSDEQLLSIANKCGEKIDLVCLSNPQLLHGLAGAYISKNIFKIEDEDILSSIKYHTTGKINMTLLEKIIYIADYIEPGRNFKGVNDLREKSFENIDEGLLLAFDNTIKFVIQNKGLLHKDTIDARNYIIKYLMD